MADTERDAAEMDAVWRAVYSGYVIGLKGPRRSIHLSAPISKITQLVK